MKTQLANDDSRLRNSEGPAGKTKTRIQSKINSKNRKHD